MRYFISALVLLATTQMASADQFIATFLNPNHPRALNIEIIQYDADGATLDTDRRRLARVGAGQSTWAVILETDAARVCVTLRGSERITGGQALLKAGGQEALQITSGGRTTCAPGSPFDLDLIIVNFE